MDTLDAALDLSNARLWLLLLLGLACVAAAVWRAWYEAQRIDRQLDWLNAAQSDSGVSEEAIREAKTVGREAGATGKLSKTNPHPKKSALHGAWQEGWLEAQDDLSGSIGRGEGAGAAAH